MYKSRPNLNLVTAATLVLMLVGGPVAASDETSSPKDLNDYQCKDVMRLSGSDRENALAFVHGYALGKKNQTQFQVDVLTAVTDKFIEHCLDHPSDNALAVFEKLAK